MYHIIWHPQVYYCVRNSPPLVVTQINTVYMFPSYLFKVHFNISPSIPGNHLHSGFQTKILMHLSSSPMCATYPIHLHISRFQ